ncbi:MAG: putative minor capsid protein [Oscillospiraceae bacterium]|nr:putative minor capsid protein [Oscillospiraceae bacterium]
MIPPIPKQLLIHSAELITEFTPDKWGKASEQDTVKLEHVRIEPSAKHVINGNGETVQLAAVLFFDCRNSSPADAQFALKDDTVNGKRVVLQKVSFGGRLYSVQTVEALYADKNRVHHYEVGLV